MGQPEDEVTLPTDAEVFEDAVSEDTPVEEVEVAPEAPPEPEPAPEPAEQPHNVPLSALLDERERRQQVQQQFEQMQQQMQQREAWENEQQRLAQEQQQAPDMFENPEYYQQSVPALQQTVQSLQGQLQQAQRMSYFQNAKAQGDMGLRFAQLQDPDTFNQAWGMLEKKTMQDGDPSWREHLLKTAMNGGDPGVELVNLYKHASVQERVGNDPDAFFTKTLEEKLSDPEFVNSIAAKLQGGAPEGSGTSVVSLPPSINKAGGGGTQATAAITDDQLWAELNK